MAFMCCLQKYLRTIQGFFSLVFLKDRPWLQVVLALLLGAFLLYLWYRKRRSDRLAYLKNVWKDAGKDVVVLHQFPRARNCPSPSPFPLKLETWLRMKGIKYVNDFEEYMSPKSKCPWITVNGVEVSDSQLAIDHLVETLEDCEPDDLSPADRGLATAVRVTLEEHFYWGLVLDRWIYNEGRGAVEHFEPIPLPKFLTKLLFKYGGKRLNKGAWEHGLGRHSRADVERLCIRDLEAVSDILGEKPFLLGDEPCEADCTLFGFITMCLHCSEIDQVYKLECEKRFKNLVRHSERMRERFWPDWEEMRYKEE